MSSIPLVALNARAPEPIDLMQSYGRALAIKNAVQQNQMQQQAFAQQQQEAPLRQRALQQQAQTGQAQLEQTQLARQDDQNFRAAMQDPSLQGKTIGEVADTLAKSGHISQSGWAQAKKADLENRTAAAGLDDKTLTNQKAAHTATQELYNNVMNLPDDQLAANWSKIAQQYDAIPGNQKQPLDPNKPMTKQELARYGPMLSLGNAYIDQELARRKTQAELKQQEAGGTSESARFISDYLKANGLEDSPANRQKGFDVFTQKTRIAPAEVRAQIMLQQPQAVFDPKTGQTVYMTRKDSIGQQTPGSIGAANLRDMVVGKDSQTLNAINTGYYHSKNFEDAARALKNGDMKALNEVANMYGVQVQSGESPQVVADLIKTALKGEMARAFTGAGATVDEQHELDKSFSNANSLDTMLGVARTARTLLHGKEVVLQRKYEQGQQGKPNFMGLGENNPSAPAKDDPFAQFGGRAH